jgi:DNA-damage-inducible protein J
MALDATVRARVDSKLKEETEKILSDIGLSTSQAITIFLKGVQRERGIPFELKIPNETTLKAMKEAKEGIGESISFEEFLKESDEQHAKSIQD